MTELMSAMILCSTAIGCGSGTSGAATSKSIAFVTGRPGSADPFMGSMTSGAQSKAAALGVDLIVQPSPDWDPIAQTPVVEDLINQKVGAIVIQPTSKGTTNMIEPLRKAFAAGIKIITADTFIGDNTYGKGGPADFPISFIGSSNVEGGKIGCDGLAEAVNDTGKVLIIGEGGVGSTSVLDRVKGCRDNLATNHPTVVIVNPGTELQGSLSAQEWATALTNQYLASDPDLGGVFATSGDTSKGATAAVLAAGRQATVRVFVFDCSAADAQNIRDGKIYGCVAQKPALMGATGVEFAHDALNGVTGLPTYVSTGFIVLNQANITDPEKAQFVYGATP
jgi:ribose transport system substrate-binding protein